MRKERIETAKKNLTIDLQKHRTEKVSGCKNDACFYEAMETVYDNLNEGCDPDFWCDSAWNIVERYVANDYPDMTQDDLEFVCDNFENYAF